MSTAVVTPSTETVASSAASAATSAPVTTPSTSAEPVTSPVTNNGGTGTSPTPGSAAASPSAPPAESANVRQLREQYESTKKQLDSYTGLGKAEELQRLHTQYQAQQKEALTLGTDPALNYTPESIQAAFEKDPIGTLALLRQEHQKIQAANGKADLSDPKALNDLIQRQLAEKTKPYDTFLDKQMTDAAEGKMRNHFDTVFKSAFPDADFPPEAKQGLFDLTDLLMGYDKPALQRLKFEGKTADVDRYFDQAKGMFLNAVNSYTAWQTKKAGPVKANGTPNVPGTPTTPAAFTPGRSRLDQMIDDPSLINQRYKD